MSPRNVPTFAFDNGIRIVPFERAHQEQVIDLFKSGLRSYVAPGPDTKGRGLLTQKFLNDKLEKDMKDVYTTYIQGGEIFEGGVEHEAEVFKGLCFFSALDSDERVVGCVGIKSVSSKEDESTVCDLQGDKLSVSANETCELVRMSVRDDCRGMGLGKKLVGAVEEFAVSNGYKRVCLSTLSAMRPAMALYKSCGYSVQREYQIPMEKLLGLGDWSPINVVYFTKDLV